MFSGNGFFTDYFDELRRRLQDASADQLGALCAALLAARGAKIILAGNGASAAIASHVAVDLTRTAGIRAITFNEADLITCLGNDHGYEHWVAKAIELYGDVGDVAVLISSSGRSPNVINAAATARANGLGVITFSGFDADNPLRGRGDLNLWVNSRSYNVIETIHQSWLLAAVDNIALRHSNA